MLTTRSSLALAVILAAACGGEAATKPAPVEAAKPAAPAPADKPVEAAPAKPAEQPVLADSGLGVGGKFKPFEIVNCDSGEKYCQVCKFGGSPKIMAVGTIDDEAFRNDIKNLDALVQKYGEDKVKAFAVITDIKDGKATTPTGDRAALEAKVKALRAEPRRQHPAGRPGRRGRQERRLRRLVQHHQEPHRHVRRRPQRREVLRRRPGRPLRPQHRHPGGPRRPRRRRRAAQGRLSARTSCPERHVARAMPLATCLLSSAPALLHAQTDRAAAPMPIPDMSAPTCPI
ncbi:hypothetical protein [Nannocystis pusilla]|uniref:hypothetical protein n=1 Tax=Nannocystis pusilla TaxID=889268 RepID=UPI003DA43224